MSNATTTQKLSWFDTEDGYVIAGTTDRREADKLHDHLVEDHLAGYEHMEESKAVNLNPPQLIYIRPDHMAVDAEDVQLDIDPATGEKLTPENGVPALFYNCN